MTGAIAKWARRMAVLSAWIGISFLVAANIERAYLSESNTWFKAQGFAFHLPQGYEADPVGSQGLALHDLEIPIAGTRFPITLEFFVTDFKAINFNLTGGGGGVILPWSGSGPKGYVPTGLHTIIISAATGALSLRLDGREIAASVWDNAPFDKLLIENVFSDVRLRSWKIISADGRDAGRRLALFPKPSSRNRAAMLVALGLLLTAWLSAENKKDFADLWDRHLARTLYAFTPLWAGSIFPFAASVWNSLGLLTAISLALAFARYFRPLIRRLGPFLPLVPLLSCPIAVIIASASATPTARALLVAAGIAFPLAAGWIFGRSRILGRSKERGFLQGAGELAPAFFPAFIALVLLAMGSHLDFTAPLVFCSWIMIALSACVRRKELSFFPPLMALAVLSILGGAEWCARASVLDAKWRPMNIGEKFVEDGDLFFVPRELFADRHYLSTGDLNFRDRQALLQAPENTYRIVVMGGSNAWGDHLAGNSETFSGLLETRLNQRPGPMRYEVLNAGVKGFEMFRVMVLLEERVLAYRPDMVIIYANLNDGFDRNGPYTLRELLAMKRQNRWGDLKERIAGAQVSAGPPAWVLWTQNHFRRFRLYNGLAKLVTENREKSTPDIAARLGVSRSVNPPEDYRENLREIIAVCAKAGIRLVLVDEFDFPFDPETFGGPIAKSQVIRGIMREEAERSGVPLLPLNLEFHHRPDKAGLVFDYDLMHLNEAGHRAVAERIAAFLEEKNLLPKK